MIARALVAWHGYAANWQYHIVASLLRLQISTNDTGDHLPGLNGIWVSLQGAPTPSTKAHHTM
jgi:hypothetical protein